MNTLKAARESRGIKQKAVAEHLGVSRQTYSRYENKQEKMSIEQAKAVCSFLNCDLADIFLPEEVN